MAKIIIYNSWDFDRMVLNNNYIFIYHRRKQIKDMKTRSMRLSITFAISNIMFCPILVVYNGFYKNSLPCLVILWNIYLSVVVYLTIIVFRGLRIIFLAQLSYAMLDSSLRTTSMLEHNTERHSNKKNKVVTIMEHLKRYRKQKKFTTDKVMCYGLFVVIGFFVITLIGITVRIHPFCIFFLDQ